MWAPTWRFRARHAPRGSSTAASARQNGDRRCRAGPRASAGRRPHGLGPLTLQAGKRSGILKQRRASSCAYVDGGRRPHRVRVPRSGAPRGRSVRLQIDGRAARRLAPVPLSTASFAATGPIISASARGPSLPRAKSEYRAGGCVIVLAARRSDEGTNAWSASAADASAPRRPTSARHTDGTSDLRR